MTREKPPSREYLVQQANVVHFVNADLIVARLSPLKPGLTALDGGHDVPRRFLNCFVLEGQMVLSPCFLGAEPNEIDTGPDAGLRLFVDEQEQGLGLMRSLDEKRRGQAWVFRQMRDPAMPPGRFHRADQRQLGGAFQDNRIIPNEGINAAQLTAS